MLPWRALIDGATLAIFDLQIGELLIAAAHIQAVGKAHKVGLKFTMKELEQEGSSDCIDRQRPISRVAPLASHPVSIAANLKPDHAGGKGLDENLSVSCVIAEVGNDQRVVVVVSIDGGLRIGTFRSEQILRQLMGGKDAQLPVTVRIVAADHRR